ncbi:MAG: hypothetical protein J6P05_04200 [Lachnospiraceae bacterium]|nr:hypothetical protein [Lachnospiraceae bacterium]
MTEADYREKLKLALRAAHENQNFLSDSDFEGFFGGFSLSDEQIEHTKAYFKEMGISIGKRPAKKKEGRDRTGRPEKNSYFEHFLNSIKRKPGIDEKELKSKTGRRALGLDQEDAKQARYELIEIYMPDVVAIARLYVYHGVPLEELVQEGNIALITGVSLLDSVDDPEDIEGFLGKMIMDAMDRAISIDNDYHSQTRDFLSRLNRIRESSLSLKEELGRDATPLELSLETGFTEDEIISVIEMPGWES